MADNESPTPVHSDLLSWEEALEYRKERLPSYVDNKDQVRHLMSYFSKVGLFCRDTNCNRCCCGDARSAFVPFGSAITSTFKLQVTLITVFFILASLALPSIVINTYGVTATGASAFYSISTTTIGNLPLIPRANMTEAYIDLPLTKNSISIPMAAVIYAGLDIVGVLIFCAAYLCLRSGLNTEEKQVNKAALGPDRYSVYLPDIPHDTTEDDIRAWAAYASKTKECPDGQAVADINIVDDNVGLLRLYTRRGELFRALARVDRGVRDLKSSIGDRKKRCLYDGEYARLAVLDKTYATLKARAEDISDKARHFKSKGATAAFVTFEHVDAVKPVLDRYPDSCSAWLCQGKKRKLKGRRLVVKAAPAPDTIQWANLNIKSGSQNARQCFTGLVAGVLIVLSFLFIVYASLTNAQMQDAMAPPDCIGTGIAQALVNGTYTNSSLMMLSPSDPVSKCHCLTRDYNAMGYDDVLADPFARMCDDRACTRVFVIDPTRAIRLDYCASWLYQKSLAVGLTVGASLSIAVVNIMLSSCMRLMTAIEGHHSSDDLNKSLVIRLFFAQFLNTAILTLIINAAWDTITGRQLPIPGTGKYDDFTAAWYGSVGASFHSTMITLAISPHIGTIIGMLGKFRMVRFASTQVSREKAIQHEQASLAEATAVTAFPLNDTMVTNPMAAVARGHGAESSAKPSKESKKKGTGRKAKALPKPLPVPPTYKVQADLNEAFVGPPADYVLRYVQMLTTVYVCYIFSAGMPLLMPIALASLVISHLVDKAAFLYFHRRPPASNNGTVKYAVELLPLAALLHLGIGIWMLGSLKTFRDAFLEGTGLNSQFDTLAAMAGNTVRSGILGTGYQRITQLQSLPLLALFVLLLVGLVLRVLLNTMGMLLWSILDALTGGHLAACTRCCGRCCKKKKASGLPTYSEAISPELLGTPGGINGVKSYNVLENPTLQAMFGISPAFAASHKGLASVANFTAADAIAAANEKTRSHSHSASVTLGSLPSVLSPTGSAKSGGIVVTPHDSVRSGKGTRTPGGTSVTSATREAFPLTDPVSMGDIHVTEAATGITPVGAVVVGQPLPQVEGEVDATRSRPASTQVSRASSVGADSDSEHE